MLSEFPSHVFDPLIFQSILLEHRVELTQGMSDLVHALSLGDCQLRLGPGRALGDGGRLEEKRYLVV